VTKSVDLRRVAARWQIVGLSLNGVIGSGVYLLPAAAAALLGPASLWAVPVAGLAVLLLVLCFAEAASHFDEPGAGYVYARAAFGELVGFEVGWMTWLARVASQAALWNAFAQALTFFWPGAAEGAVRVALITLPLACVLAINVLGVHHGVRLAVGFAVAKILPLLFLIVVGLPVIDWSLVLPMPAPDAAGLGAAATLLLYAYAGFENTAAAAGEFKNPQRDVPFALLAMIAGVTLLYTLIQLVALGTLPDLAARAAGAPLADSAVRIAGVWAGVLMTLGAAVSIGGLLSGGTLDGPRYLYALAKNGFGPPILAGVHERYQTPAWAIATHALIVLTLALSGSFVQLATLSVVARLTTYLGTVAALPVLRRKFPPGEHTIVLPGGATIPVLALLVCIGFLASATVQNLAAGLIALFVGGAVYALRRKTPSSGASRALAVD
jgi:basic amino acid/polyamine antiporter, APA family